MIENETNEKADVKTDAKVDVTADKKPENSTSVQSGSSTATVKKPRFFADFKTDFAKIDKNHRITLFVQLGVIFAALLAYIIFCLCSVAIDRNATLKKYRQDSDMSAIYDKYDATQSSYHNKLAATENSKHINVKVGSKLYGISGINAKNGAFNATLELWFTFDKNEFDTMFTEYCTHAQLPAGAVASDYYPATVGATHSMFVIGNGSLVPNTFSVIDPVKEYTDADGNTLCYQKVRFDVSIGKSFDSVRYPLESAQFKIYIQPTMDSEFMRYLPDMTVNSNSEWTSGFSPYFGITNGYRKIKESSDINAFNMRVNYYKDVNNDPSVDYNHTYKTQIEIAVRANRGGIGLFLQAFINLFAVTLWMMIAFYNTSFNKEHAVDMFGTGLFGAISSILVGLQLISDAAMFSLITMINIFTLIVILMMTFQTIRSKQVHAAKNESQMAFQSIKLKTMLFMMLFTTLVMFAVVPLTSYLFIL